jgi:uncharacterized protein
VIGEREVERVVEMVVALCRPDEIYVFGSYAKGTLHEGSDLDVIVIKPSSLPRHRRGREVEAMLAHLAFSVDVLFFTPRELQQELADPYSLVSAIMPSAKLLYRTEGDAPHAG